MPATRKFSVAREHLGDRAYVENDVREAAPGDVTHLVRSGVLLDDGGAKAEAAHKNKMEPAPANKAGARGARKA